MAGTRHERWCDRSMMPQSHQNFRAVLIMKLLGDASPPLFTLLQPEMPTDGTTCGQYDRPLSLRNSYGHCNMILSIINFQILHWPMPQSHLTR